MRIYEALKGILTEEQLKDFENEVKSTIEEAVEKKSGELSELSEQYVKQAIAEKEQEFQAKIKEFETGTTDLKASLKEEYEQKLQEAEAEKEALRVKLEEDYENKLDEAAKEAESEIEEYKAQLQEEYEAKKAELDEKCMAEAERKVMEENLVTQEQFDEFKRMFFEKEERAVEALNNFLDERIEVKLPERLVKESVVSQELMGLVDGIKMLFEEHYAGIDPTAGVRKMKDENKKLKEAYEQSLIEKADLAQKVESAATRLLITEKTRDMSETQAKKVMTYFEGRDFDFVKSRIDDMVLMTENETEADERRAKRSERRLKRLDEVRAGFIPERKPVTEDSSFFAQVNKYM